jgi:NADH-quinone oxidoreductase subunit F
MPTLFVSAETLARVAALEGGTMVVTVLGRGGERTLEVPLGTTVASVIEAVEGTSVRDSDIAVVRFGGVLGRFLARDQLGVSVSETPEGVAGAGSIAVLRGQLCGVELVRDTMSYLHEQSCGKCVACREGTYQLLDLLSDMAACRAEPPDLELLRELCRFIPGNSICGVGRNVCVPVQSALDLFAPEFEAHVESKLCTVAVS